MNKYTIQYVLFSDFNEVNHKSTPVAYVLIEAPDFSTALAEAQRLKPANATTGILYDGDTRTECRGPEIMQHDPDHHDTEDSVYV